MSSTGKDLSSEVSDFFGRCPFFLIINDKGDLVEAIENPFINQRGGAGISAAKLVAQKGAKSIIAGHIGPRALSILEQFDIKVHLKKGLVKDVIKDL